MTKALSVDLRERVVQLVVEGGHSCREAARMFSIGASTAIRCVARYKRTGSVAPAPQGGDRRSKLKVAGSYVLQRVAAVPDITLAELTRELSEQGITIHYSNVSRYLKAHDLTYKKNAAGRRTEAAGCLAAARRMDQGSPADHATSGASPCLY